MEIQNEATIWPPEPFLRSDLQTWPEAPVASITAARETLPPPAKRRFAYPAELSIIIPTFNERSNVKSMITAIEDALPNISWEIVFVDDDSPDGTATLVREIARHDPRVRCIHRFRRRGLSSACVEGIMATAAPIIAVMDCDHQHDERILRQMYDVVRSGRSDIVVGSRYVEGGSFGDCDQTRAAMSQLATRVAGWITGLTLRDPMSGFFVMRREAFLEALPKLSSIGFKILMDIIASSRQRLRIVELPYTFRARRSGESKLDVMVLWEYLLLVADKFAGGVIPPRFISFALVGGSGVLVHLSILTALLRMSPMSFIAAETVAVIGAITTNFLLNNVLTYHDRRLTGMKLVTGWLSFSAVCAVGAAANVGIANWIYLQNSRWLFSALAGIAASVVWNYATSSVVTWNK